ncbi:hypothetical protein [Streptomyces sp. HNM0574]|uniref:hypothetical protein n=1 Tax=Streptomyces sp. HNM0574 TaxID=2714954 RepID=UPI00146B5254|nr:hypothetical protein [Streptomyces sp. HNM0574]NLU66685.1 hypothetical protein [Streptomyces sp. HNM0574]
MAGGYRLDPDALRKVEKGINDAMEELKEFGFDISANLGHGFSDMELKGLEVGDAELTDAFAGFCDRWGWGVHGLMQDANDIAMALNLNAGMYHEQEQYVSGTLKTVVSSAMGDPGLSQEEIEGRSWKETLGDNAYTQARDADYSTDSLLRGASDALGSWGQTVEDVKSSPLGAGPGYTDRVDWQWDGEPEAGGSGSDGGKG